VELPRRIERSAYAFGRNSPQNGQRGGKLARNIRRSLAMERAGRTWGVMILSLGVGFLLVY
jgi:hypothetical protein